MTKTRYVDITCDGCQAGWTLTPKDEREDGATYMKREGWVQVGEKHFCKLCIAKGLATKEVEFSPVFPEEDFWAGLKEG